MGCKGDGEQRNPIFQLTANFCEGLMMKWFHDEGYGVDIEALRNEFHPGLMNFEDWMEKKSKFETK